MSYKVAFASNDGKVVNQHFGRTKKFLIFEVDGNDTKFLELRENIPPCQGYEHLEEEMLRAVNLISDCKAVFVSKIGYGALVQLGTKGIKAYEAPFLIEDVLKKIITSLHF